MTKLLAEAIVLQNRLGLDETHLAAIHDAMRNYAASMVNAAKPLIDTQKHPAEIRRYMEPLGLTYDGAKKQFK